MDESTQTSNAWSHNSDLGLNLGVSAVSTSCDLGEPSSHSETLNRDNYGTDTQRAFVGILWSRLLTISLAQ